MPSVSPVPGFSNVTASASASATISKPISTQSQSTSEPIQMRLSFKDGLGLRRPRDDVC